MTNFDFHSHSTASDGTLAPAVLAERAAANGVDLWALTDHDVLHGLTEARAAAERAGVAFIDGIEISVTWRAQTIHIVGLDVDPRDATLVGGIEAVRSNRRARAARIAAGLEAIGVQGALEGAYRFAETPDMIGRTHFARYLVEQGYARSIDAVFKRYLSPGKPGYVPHEWAQLGEAVAWIRAAGGVPVIAHPGRYGLSPDALRDFIGEFKTAGGLGIEVVTGSHTPDQYGPFAQLARDFGLLASRGSDFHGPEESTFDLGAMPALPDDLSNVLEALAPHGQV